MTTTPTDPGATLRSREYTRVLVLAAVLGLPISALAYGFLTLVTHLQTWIFDDLPQGFGFSTTPAWWPLPVLGLAGVLVALVITYLPGNGGHEPAHGLDTSSPSHPRDLPGIFAAALIGLSFGVVLGPEAPLIALGGGLAVAALGRSAANRPAQAVALVASIGSFAAVATLLGSPIVGAFLIMEAIGIGGPALGLVLLPGLLAAGIGSLIFVGLGAWTGFGTMSLAIPDLPSIRNPDLAQIAWAIGIGLGGAVVGTGIRRLALVVLPIARAHRMLVTPVMGVVIAALAIVYAQISGHSTSDVLYSGQDELGPLLTTSAGYSVGALLLLVACKSLAYTAALSSFRGGPVFPSMFVGAAGGLALSHLPGLPPIAGAAMGIAALCATMLRLPLTAVLLTALFLGTDGIQLTPLIVVSAVVAYVVSARLTPVPPPAAPAPAPAGP